VFAPTLGRMAKNLAAAGVDPATVDMVILTHLHPDHAAGLLTTDKKIAIANRKRVFDMTRRTSC